MKNVERRGSRQTLGGVATAAFALTVGVLSTAASPTGQRDSPQPEPTRFRIDAQSSRVTIEVGKAGLFRFAGHDHEVVTSAVSGTVMFDDADPARSSLTVVIDATTLVVTGEGEPAQDVPEVQRTMLSERVLAVEEYPTIVFESDAVSVRERTRDQRRLRITGQLTLRGVARRQTIDVDVDTGEAVLTATAEFDVKQRDFGIDPVSAGLGTVKVRNELRIHIVITARRASRVP